MIPVITEYSNIKYTAKGCRDLPATLCKNSDGTIETETVWELSEEELAQIIKNKRVYLYVYGGHVPPVALYTESQIIHTDGGT